MDDAVVEPNARQRLYDTIQETAHFDDELEGSVLIGFMVVAEWSGPTGDQWLSKVSGDHSTSLAAWRQRGFAAEVLHAFWGDQPDGTEEDEGQ